MIFQIKAFRFINNTICTQCSQQFDKCNLCNFTDCLNCENGYFLDGGSCFKCMDNCKSCSIFVTCDICNDGYFGSSCDMCYGSCKNCIGSQKNDCTECKEDTYQDNIVITLGSISTFSCECDFLFYLDSNFDCKPCDTKCNQCDGGTNFDCLDCYLSQNRMRLGKSCVCDTANYYLDLGDDICYEIHCGYGCANCQNTGALYACQACHSSETNRVDDPQQNCPCQQGYYEVYEKSCKKCPTLCQTCSLDSSNKPYCIIVQQLILQTK